MTLTRWSSEFTHWKRSFSISLCELLIARQLPLLRKQVSTMFATKSYSMWLTDAVICTVFYQLKPWGQRYARHPTFKGVMSWPKVSSLVFRFGNAPWTIGPNTQLKWKLRYSLIQCAYLEPSALTFFRPSRQPNWSRDRKLTQSCWCLHWLLGLRVDVWKMLLQAHTWPVVTQVWIEKMFDKNIEIGFQSAVFHLCQRASVPLLRHDRGPKASASI